RLLSCCAFSSFQTFCNFSSPNLFTGECLEFANLYRCPGPSLFSIFHKSVSPYMNVDVLAGSLSKVYLEIPLHCTKAALWLGPITLGKKGIKLARFRHVLPNDCFQCCLQARFTHCIGFPAIVLGLAQVICQVFSLFGQD